MIDPLRSVAIVGRPNVGKSRMFNRLVGKRLAIVHDMPGVTRDLATADVEDDFVLMDTGGIGMQPEMTSSEIHAATEEQVDFAINAAAAVLFVCDGHEGCTTIDYDLAEKLRRFNKPTILVVNKVERKQDEERLNDFYDLGFGEPVPVSSEHGLGFDELFGIIHKTIGPKPAIDPAKEAEEKRKGRIKICLCGKPNVGKSSLGNRLLNTPRLIVSDVAGTTRDSIETDLDFASPEGETWSFRLIDTAGVKANRKLGSSIDYFSNLRTGDAIERTDVAFLILDAMTGVTKHDKKLAGDILRAGCGLVIVVNKWDYAVEQFQIEPIRGFDSVRDFGKAFIKSVQKELFFLPDSPVIFTSAKENLNVEGILREARKVHHAQTQQLPTSRLNKTISDLLERNQPKIVSNRRFKIYYAVQTGTRPIRMRMFCNSEERLDDRYKRYLQTGVHKAFDLDGCPVVFELFGKPKNPYVEDRVKPDRNERNSLSKHGKAREKGDSRRGRGRSKRS